MSRYALVCASDFAADDFARRNDAAEFERIVAVDSGLSHLGKLGVEPDEMLGDFDSLGYIPAGAYVHPAIKDKSDLELALDFALEHGGDDIVVYGCLGGRLDHTLAALQNLAAVAETGVRVRAVGAPWGDERNANSRARRVTMLEVLPGPCALTIRVSEDAEAEEVADLGAPTYGSVSVFAATDVAHGVTERGMFYPLEGATLTNRTSLGLSNELVCPKGEISVLGGTLFALYPADLRTHLTRNLAD